MTKALSRVMLLVISVVAGKLLFECFAGEKQPQKKSAAKKLAPKKREEKTEEAQPEAKPEAECGCGCANLFNRIGIDPAALLKQVFAGSEK